MASSRASGSKNDPVVVSDNDNDSDAGGVSLDAVARAQTDDTETPTSASSLTNLTNLATPAVPISPAPAMPPIVPPPAPLPPAPTALPTRRKPKTTTTPTTPTSTAGPSTQAPPRRRPSPPLPLPPPDSTFQRASQPRPRRERPRSPPLPPPPPASTFRRHADHASGANWTSASRAPQPAAPSPGPSRPDVVLPRWQPDAEVTYCPICHTQFNVFIRKHHCRRCGRVVCNSCSPHRITIPYQYIVHPPGRPAGGALLGDVGIGIGIGGGGSSGGPGEEFSGGERVRLCNPCVPDPNTTPPQTQHPGAMPQSRSHARSVSHRDGSSPRYGSSGIRSAASSLPDAAGRNFPGARAFDGHTVMSPFATAHPAAQHNATNSVLRYFTDIPNDSPWTRSPANLPNVSQPQPRPPQIPEEDECPVCHRELPSRQLPNFETLREEHIMRCVEAHSMSGRSRHRSSTSAASNGVAAGSGSGGSGGGGGGGGSGGGGGGSSSAAAGSSTASPEPMLPPVPRLTGVFPYLATEKDCVDSAECTICLEEFEVGVPMARLECMCRFHRSCIAAWFVNHPGRCPVHQHDSYGY